MASIPVFIAISADDVPMQEDMQGRYGDPEQLRKIHQSIESADRSWKNWAESTGGSLISIGRGQILIQTIAENLPDLTALRETYAKALESKVSVGVGTTIADAEIARKVAVKRGVDLILLHQPGIERELEDKQESPLVVDTLAKANGGFVHSTGENHPKPPEEAPGSEPETSMNDPAPPPVNEQDFHDLADAQAEKDNQPDSSSQIAQTKLAVIKILEQIRAQGPVLAQIKQTKPDTYAAVMALVQGVIQLAHALPQSIAKGEATLESDEDEDEIAKAAMAVGHTEITLPVGTTVEPGPTSAGDPKRVGKIKIKDSSGKAKWVSARAGQIAAVDDRNAPPILGANTHPVSSRNQTGH